MQGKGACWWEGRRHSAPAWILLLKRVCALKIPEAKAKGVTSPNSEEPEGAGIITPFRGGSLGFQMGYKLIDRTVSHPTSMPGVCMALASPVREKDWVRKHTWPECHNQGGRRRGQRQAPPPGQVLGGSLVLTFFPTSMDPGQGSATPCLTLPQPTQTTESLQGLAPPTQWRLSTGAQHL